MPVDDRAVTVPARFPDRPGPLLQPRLEELGDRLPRDRDCAATMNLRQHVRELSLGLLAGREREPLLALGAGLGIGEIHLHPPRPATSRGPDDTASHVNSPPPAPVYAKP